MSQSLQQSRQVCDVGDIPLGERVFPTLPLLGHHAAGLAVAVHGELDESSACVGRVGRALDGPEVFPVDLRPAEGLLTAIRAWRSATGARAESETDFVNHVLAHLHRLQTAVLHDLPDGWTRRVALFTAYEDVFFGPASCPG